MRFFKMVLLGLGVVVCAAPAALSQTVYECSFARQGAHGGWIPEAVVVVHDELTGSAVVNDPFVAATSKQPVVAKIIANNDKRASFSWEVKGLTSATGQRVRLMLRLTVLKADLAGSVTSQALGYDGGFSAQGRCKKGKL